MTGRHTASKSNNEARKREVIYETGKPTQKRNKTNDNVWHISALKISFTINIALDNTGKLGNSGW